MSTPKYKLTYFDVRGRAEVSRMVFAFAGQSFEDNRIAEEWQELKPKIPGGQLPVLEVDGKRIIQSLTIVKYLARVFGTGLIPRDDFEGAQVEQIVDTTADLNNAFIQYYFTEDNKNEQRKKLLTETFPKLADTFTILFKQNTNKDAKYFVGDKLTLADLAVYEAFTSYLKLDKELFNKYPELARHREVVAQHPKLKDYLDRRPERDI